MSDDSISEGEAKWAIEIGRFVMAFGSIEALTYTMLRQLPRDPIGEKLIESNASFKVRLELLSAIAWSRDGPHWDRVGTLIDEVALFVKKRNLVAHGAPSFEIYVNDSGDLAFREWIRSGRAPGSPYGKPQPRYRMDFEELVQARKEIAELNRSLLQAYGDAIEEFLVKPAISMEKAEPHE